MQGSIGHAITSSYQGLRFHKDLTSLAFTYTSTNQDCNAILLACREVRVYPTPNKLWIGKTNVALTTLPMASKGEKRKERRMLLFMCVTKTLMNNWKRWEMMRYKQKKMNHYWSMIYVVSRQISSLFFSNLARNDSRFFSLPCTPKGMWRQWA